MIMKIKWKQVCIICMAPLDPYYTQGKGWELRLFDEYLKYTNLPFENNNTCGWRGVKICKACHVKGGFKYNPKIDALRQIGAIRDIRPRRASVSRDETKQWRDEFYKILKENKPK